MDVSNERSLGGFKMLNGRKLASAEIFTTYTVSVVLMLAHFYD